MGTNRKCIYIPSVDAKDLYLANNFNDKKKNEVGYRLVDKNNEINYKRFINSMDFSLDSEEIRRIASEVYTKEPLTFCFRGKEYSDKIINVTFKYSAKEFNKIKKDTYVMDGYFLNDITFNDCIAIEDNQIVGIITSTPVNSKTFYDFPDDFKYVENLDGTWTYEPKTIGVVLSRKELRKYLYKNGFNCNGVHYVRLKRTSGSARVGKCLFVDERLYGGIHEWEMCDLDINEGDPVDLAALESYISLPTSSAIDTLFIDPKNILIIPDYDSHFKEDSVVVRMDDNCRVYAKEEEIDVSNSIFDGQSLIDESIMGEYSKYGMVLLRNRFFKSCCFNTNIQQWFADNNITELSQLHPDSITIAEKIEDIKLITTPNSVKYVKFASIEKWLRTIRPMFSVVKHEKKTHFFDGQMVQAHYQLLNTLQLSPEEVHDLLKPSLDYVNMLNTNPDVLKYHVKCSVADDGSVRTNVMKDKNEIVYTMMNLSKDFPRTKYYYDFKKDVCSSYLKNMKKGHILINGNYSVLFGNPYEMLLHTLGKFDGSSSLPPEHVHTTRYSYGKKIIGCRSPHITTSNLFIATNCDHPGIEKYFNLTQEIVCINAINENSLERLSGADYDSDQMIVSDNEIIINAALKNYSVFKVPANRVNSKKIQRYYTAEEKADLDHRTSDNKIGEIVNLSQELNTLLWNTVNNLGVPASECYDSIRELYHDICILNVLSCIEIDKAKKEYDTSAAVEIAAMKTKWIGRTYDGKMIKPAFLGFIAGTKGFRNPSKKEYNYHKTTMDYLLKEINKHRSKKANASDLLPFSKCFRFNWYSAASVNRYQISSVISAVEKTLQAISAIWQKEYYSTEEKHAMTMQYHDELLYLVQNMKMNIHTMYALLRRSDMPKYKSISKTLIKLLFSYSNETMLELMNNLNKVTSHIEPDPDGDLDIYGIKFKQYTEAEIEEN